MKYSKRIKTWIFCLLFISIIVLTSRTLFAPIFQDITIIENPKPNIIEQEYIQLKEVRTISGDLGNDNFLFLPISMDIDNSDNIYVYDQFESKIFKLTNDFELVDKFLGEGQGPGEITKKGGFSSASIHVGRNEKLYVSNLTGIKIMELDLKGNFIKEKKFKVNNPYLLISKNGNYYLHSAERGIIDVFDKDFDYIDTLLNIKENYVYLFQKPETQKFRILLVTNFYRQFSADLTLDSLLLLYLRNSSKLFIFKDNEIISEYNIYPKVALESTKKNSKEYKTNINIFERIFADKDDENFFYLSNLSQYQTEKRFNLYKFNLKGELIKVLFIDNKKPYPNIQFKKNGTFYAIEDEKIVLYKEVNQ